MSSIELVDVMVVLSSVEVLVVGGVPYDEVVVVVVVT